MALRWSLERGFVLVSALVSLALVACGSNKFDCSSPTAKQATLDATNLALTIQDCGTAITLINPLYESSCTDNSVRLLRSSAYACAANVNFFNLAGDLSSTTISGSALWSTLAKIFPSIAGDSRAESGWYASDALQATNNTSSVVTSAHQITFDSYNTGSTYAADHTTDANVYLIFTSMAVIGALENRYSAPDLTNYKKTHVLGYTVAKPGGWEVAANMTAEGCSYGGAVLNMIDAMGQANSSFPAALAKKIASVQQDLSAAIDEVCEAGCSGTALNGYNVTGCALPAGTCYPCPQKLRDRTSCNTTGVSTDIYSCAAAAIAHFVNSDSNLGWQ